MFTCCLGPYRQPVRLLCMARRNCHDESLSIVRIAVKSNLMGKGWNDCTEGHVFRCSTQGKDMFSQPSSTSESGQRCAPCQTRDLVHQPCLPLCLDVWVCRLTPPSCTLRMMEKWNDFIASWNKCYHYLSTMVPNHYSDLNPNLTATIKPHFNLKTGVWNCEHQPKCLHFASKMHISVIKETHMHTYAHWKVKHVSCFGGSSVTLTQDWLTQVPQKCSHISPTALKIDTYTNSAYLKHPKASWWITEYTAGLWYHAIGRVYFKILKTSCWHVHLNSFLKVGLCSIKAKLTSLFCKCTIFCLASVAYL